MRRIFLQAIMDKSTEGGLKTIANTTTVRKIFAEHREKLQKFPRNLNLLYATGPRRVWSHSPDGMLVHHTLSPQLLFLALVFVKHLTDARVSNLQCRTIWILILDLLLHFRWWWSVLSFDARHSRKWLGWRFRQPIPGSFTARSDIRTRLHKLRCRHVPAIKVS